MKRILFAIPVLLLIAVFFPFLQESFQRSEPQKTLVQEPAEKPITLLFVGDIMLDRGVEWKVKTEGRGDWTWPFMHIADTLSKADLLFGNLESIVSDKGIKVGSIYSFRANPQSMEALTFAGFDVVSVANNHSFDYTREAFHDSLLRLQDAKIAYTGGGLNANEANSPLIQEVGGMKIAFLGYTNSGSPLWQAAGTHAGIAWADASLLPAIAQSVQEAKAQSDIVVVSLHAGEEYLQEPNEFQKLFGKTAIDAGADIAVMHHAHVVQPLEQYKHGWIAYGLGNFLFDQSFSQETMQGAILKVILEDKKMSEVNIIDTLITESFQVKIQ